MLHQRSHELRTLFYWGTYLLNLTWPFEGTHLLNLNRPNEKGTYLLNLSSYILDEGRRIVDHVMRELEVSLKRHQLVEDVVTGDAGEQVQLFVHLPQCHLRLLSVGDVPHDVDCTGKRSGTVEDRICGDLEPDITGG